MRVSLRSSHTYEGRSTPQVGIEAPMICLFPHHRTQRYNLIFDLTPLHLHEQRCMGWQAHDHVKVEGLRLRVFRGAVGYEM